MKVLFVLVLSALLSSTTLAAENVRPSLQVQVALGERAAQCGIDKQSIESIAALTLRNNGIRAAKERTEPYLYISAAVGPKGAGCMANLLVSVRVIDFFAGRGGFAIRDKLAAVILCNSDSVLRARHGEMATTFNSALEDQIKVCLGQLDY
jgi:hypothetical protein